MDKFIDFFKNDLTIAYLVPIFTAAIGGIGKIIVDRMREKRVGIPYKVRKRKSINVFNKYCERNKIKSIISYRDSNALKVISENDRGNIIVKADFDLKELPKHSENRNFVMILLKYIPKSDMSYFWRKGYSFMFDIKARKGLHGIQLEIKDIHGAKVLDEFVKVFQEEKHYSFKLNEYTECEAWKEISEICFTIFTENGYVTKKTGGLEICNCMLKIE